MKLNKPIVVRKEDFGLLVWSPKYDSYFLPDADSMNDLMTIINRKNVGLSNAGLFEGIDKILAEELKHIGFEGPIRMVDNPIEGRLSAPLDAYFDYTWACNLRCGYCYNFDVDRNVTMPNDQIIQVLTQMADLGIMRTHLAGGEPMINPDRFETYLKTAHELGMNSSVNCNGTRVTDRTIKSVFDYGVITLTFSMDGHTAEAHEVHRGIGNFMVTRNNATKVRQIKDELGYGPRLQYKAVHMFDTPFEQLEGLVSIAIADGMDVMQFHNPERCIDHDKGHYGNPKVIDGYYERARFISALQKEYGDQIQIWNIWNPLTGCGDIGLPGMTGCIGGQELIAISADGSLNPCLMNKYGLGNLFEDWNGDFASFWKGSDTLYEFHMHAGQVDKACNPCEFYAQCRGGSKTRVIVQNREGNNSASINLSEMSGYDPLCPKDYLQRHEEVLIPSKRVSHFNRLRPIYMSHSL